MSMVTLPPREPSGSRNACGQDVFLALRVWPVCGLSQCVDQRRLCCLRSHQKAMRPKSVATVCEKSKILKTKLKIQIHHHRHDRHRHHHGHHHHRRHCHRRHLCLRHVYTASYDNMFAIAMLVRSDQVSTRAARERHGYVNLRRQGAWLPVCPGLAMGDAARFLFRLNADCGLATNRV